MLMNDPKQVPLLLTLLLTLVLSSGCVISPPDSRDSDLALVVDNAARLSRIPADVVKGTPANDEHPPLLDPAFASEFEEPVPLPGGVNTAGAEDSPFVPADGKELYFFFANDVRDDASIQVRDPVNGIWVSRKIGDGASGRPEWGEPELVVLQEAGKLALNGCEFVSGNGMLFCSAREGYTGVGWFSASRSGADGKWSGWKPVVFDASFDVGELHILGNELYYHSARTGGKGGLDIWMLSRDDGSDGLGEGWGNPVNVAAVNSPANEGWPYLTTDGKELWFNREYQGTPAVFRSVRDSASPDSAWGEPQLVVSQFAGEPTLDSQGNLYFVHHYYREGKMIEADIYVAYRKVSA
jgi:hypothetical protein